MELLAPQDFKDGKIKRKRRRISKACIPCKTRKIKCDRATPFCSSCEMKGITECVYEQSPFATSLIQDELSRLKQENNKLKEMLSIQGVPNTANSVQEIGPQKQQQSDQKLDLSQQTSILHKKSRIVFYGTTSFRATAENYRSLYFSYFKSLRKAVDPSRKAWRQRRKDYLNYLSIPDGTVNPKGLLTHLEAFLPSHSTIKLILEEFFESLWFKFFPIIDKASFFEDFERIFAEQSDGSQKITLMYKEADYARVALVLAVLKLISAFQYRGVELTIATVFVDKGHVMSEYVDKFLNCARYMTRTSLPTLQATLILRSTKRFLAKDGDGGDASNGSIYFGLAFEFAMTLGLNGDIDMLYKNESTEYRSTLKNMWRSILFMDAMNSFDVGMPPHISERFYNLDSINDGSLMFMTTMAMHRVMTVVNGQNVTVAEVENEVQYLHSFAEENFGPIYTNIQEVAEAESPAFSKIEKAVLHIQVLYIISTLYFVLIKAATTAPQKEKNYLMCVKSGLLATFAFESLLHEIEKYDTLPISSYIKNHLFIFIFSLVKFSHIKFLFYIVFFFVAELNNLVAELYRPYCDTTVGPPPETVTVHLSEWQKLKFDDTTDPFAFRDLCSISNIFEQLFRKLFARKRACGVIFASADDPQFFIHLKLFKFVHNCFLNDKDLAPKAALFKTDIKFDFDVPAGKIIFDDPVSETLLKEGIDNLLGENADDDTNGLKDSSGTATSFFDQLFEDFGFEEWLI